ncbi:MAG: methyltransferase domain-containing protein [Candidatus Omnitrophica bacterium]|nr:methyltransferase domain-containing protein [Candidatus Omnitrophota bacterium]
MPHDKIIRQVGDYYTQKVETHGPSAQGVDWNSTESQFLRFKQLLRVAEGDSPFSINDFGCGYGGLVEYLETLDCPFEYRGFDISQAMVGRAREIHGAKANCRFVQDETQLEKADYTVASGIFNVKMETPVEEWKDYCLKTIDKLAGLSNKGFAFNVLTSYSDAEYMRPDLYYADPCFLFDHCKRQYSRWVSLLHDYGLYEFTILVRADNAMKE